MGITIDQRTGTLFVADSSNHAIRRITSKGMSSAIASLSIYSPTITGEVSTVASKFNEPHGIHYDEHSQSLLVCDRNYDKLNRVTLNGSHISSLYSPPCLPVSLFFALLCSLLLSTYFLSKPPFYPAFSLYLLRRYKHCVHSSKTYGSDCDFEWDHPGGI